MTEQKQIEEMAKIASKCITSWLNNETPKTLPDYIAKHLYNAGYCKQITGEWEMQKFPLTQCSVCGAVRNCETEMGWNYCPNCGARMKGVEGDG